MIESLSARHGEAAEIVCRYYLASMPFGWQGGRLEGFISLPGMQERIRKIDDKPGPVTHAGMSLSGLKHV